MEEFALLLIKLSIFVFVLTRMFAMGLSHAVKQLLDPEVDTAQVSQDDYKKIAEQMVYHRIG